MNNFINSIIEETVASKYREKRKKKMKELSDERDDDKISEKDENVDGTEIDEIVDKNGMIAMRKFPKGLSRKNVSAKNITDKVVKSAGASMGIHGVHGTHTSLRYWAESKKQLKNIIENYIDEIEMKDALGYDETMAKDLPYETAKKVFKRKLKLSDDETEERLEKMGYDEDLPDDKVRLIENPKSFIEEFIESIVNKRSNDYDIVRNERKDISELSPIIKRQLESLKTTLNNNNLTVDDVLEYLKNYE